MTVLRVGKHKGKSYSAVAESDRSYCSWVLRLGSHSTSSGLDKFSAFLKKKHRHKGKYYTEIVEEDTDYCSWVLRLGSHSTSSGLDKFASYLKKNHGGILPIGRHKGKFYKEIIEEDSDYCSWASQIEKPGDPLKDFAHYLKLHWKESDRDDSGAKGSEECKICFSAAINTVLGCVLHAQNAWTRVPTARRPSAWPSNASMRDPRRRSRFRRSNSPPSDFVGKLRASAGSPYSCMG